MKTFNRFMRVFSRRISHFVVFLAIATAYLAGLLSFLDQKSTDARFRLLDRQASQDILLVEIDAQSLHELNVWPWPRSYHAAVVQNLRSAGAERIVFDVDFSSHSDPREDAVFGQALAEPGGMVILPVFAQDAHHTSEQTNTLLAVPIPELLEHVSLASANVVPDRDGQVRQMNYLQTYGDQKLPSLFASLTDVEYKNIGRFHVDYGIEPGSIARVSYADVLLGRFDRDMVAGRSILIGATALELGDILTVPVHRALPGAIVQLLAYESVVQGRALKRVPPSMVLAATFFILLIIGPLLFETSWRRGLMILVPATLMIWLISLGVQAAAPLMLDVVPLLLGLVFSYAVALVGQINQQDFRLMAQGLVIRRRDAFMRQVMDNSVDGIVVLDKDLKIKDLNQAAQNMLRIDLDQVTGEPFAQVAARIQPEDNGAQLVNNLQHRGDTHEFRLDGLAAGIMFFEMTARDTRVDHELNVIVLLRDVTAEKRAKIQAKKSQLFLQEALESMHEGFALYDSNDHLMLSNSTFRRMLFGDTKALPPGMTFKQVMQIAAQQGRLSCRPEDDGADLDLRVARHQRREGQYEEVLEDGTYLQISERGTFDHGTVSIYHDVTDLKEREIQLQEAVERETFANRCKTEFLGNMSGELRTPLNLVIGYSEIISKQMIGPLGDPEYKSYADEILGSGQHLLALINDILDVSQIETGKNDLVETEIDVSDVIQACLRMLKARIVEADLHLVVDAPAILPMLLGCPRAMKQVVLNLLSNAIKFTSAKGTISVRARMAKNGEFILQITDTGIGMAPEDIPGALSLFGQVESQRARKFDGLGLGLPLARKLTELHGGRMVLESKAGTGTRVTLAYPDDRVLMFQEPQKAEIAG